MLRQVVLSGLSTLRTLAQKKVCRNLEQFLLKGASTHLGLLQTGCIVKNISSCAGLAQISTHKLLFLNHQVSRLYLLPLSSPLQRNLTEIRHGEPLATFKEIWDDETVQEKYPWRRNPMYHYHFKPPDFNKRRKKNPLGKGIPFCKGIILKTLIKKPKKPNSANRKCVLVKLSNGKEMLAHVPGEGHNLQEHNIVLVRVGRLQDVPGVKLKCVRGAYDLPHVVKKK